MLCNILFKHFTFVNQQTRRMRKNLGSYSKDPGTDVVAVECES